VSTIRPATESDIPALCALDQVACAESARRDFIRDAVLTGRCTVVEDRGEAIAYAVLEHGFFAHSFVAMLYVHPDLRRQGFGAALMEDMEARSRTDTLFTSTNESNRPMRDLLDKLGFEPSGRIENLDEGDPELVFCKRRSCDATDP